MSDPAKLFQERYREFPAFQKAMEWLEVWERHELSREELATRILMFQENPLNWDTLCHNCAALMDKNYEQYVEIQKLKEQIEHPVLWICGTCGRHKGEGHYCNPDF